MIQITCPSNNIPERTYAINIIFNELMGCGLDLNSIVFSDDAEEYTIGVGDKRLIVEDHFFNYYREPLSYLNNENLPKELHYFHARGMEIPIIYGVDRYSESGNTITIGLDIFASTFFMLSRWEESLYGRDEEGDCKETKLFTVVNNIHKRPIVHEYEFFLRDILQDLNISLKQRSYKVVMTHDVDGLITPSWMRIIKDFKFRIKNGPLPASPLNMTWRQKMGYKLFFPNEYKQVGLYVDLCEKYNVPEWFYFKVCAANEVESTYTYDDSRVQKVIDKLVSLNSTNIQLGFHPSQSTFNNENQWNQECQRISRLLGFNPKIGRNHHLLFNLYTLRLWESSLAEQKSQFDISNCVFHGRHGFRSGIAVPYPIFDYYQRRQMELREHPNHIMDTVIRYQVKTMSDEERYNDIKTVVDSVSKYNGELVLTWHIYLRKKQLILDYFDWCIKTIEYATEKRK